MADDRCDLLCLDLPRAELIRQNRLDPERALRLAGRGHLSTGAKVAKQVIH